MGDFEHDTAVRAREDGAFDCEIGLDWWVRAGPNGGYLAAIMVRALAARAESGDGGRPLRSLTVHYLRAPQAGPARVEVVSEREGRSVSFTRARLLQGDRPAAVAMAVFALERDGMELDHARAPRVPSPEEIAPVPDVPDGPRFAREFDFRPALGGGPFDGAEEALAGGWLRFREDSPRALDAAALVALCDSWFPAVFATTPGPLAVPTLELTVHVRAPRLPLASRWVLGHYSTRLARGGFLEEDAEIFSRDGALLAQSRQLALAG